MQRPIRWYDYITINIYWFALTTRSQTLAPLVIPLLVQQFVGEEAKGAYVGTIRLWALMSAVLIQAVMGILSDHSTSRWGKRRPFILVGALAEAVVIALIGFTAGMEGMSGYWVLFGLYILSMFTSNTAHAATQGLIPDLVPEEKRGRFSGVKALLELPVPVIFVSFVIGNMVGGGNLWGALVVLIAILLVCMAISLFAPEQPQKEPPFKLDWKPIVRLLVMTAVFSAIILGLGTLVKAFVALDLGLSPAMNSIVYGAIGVVSMVIAVALGVLISLRIGAGEEGFRNTSFRWWVVNRLAFLVGSTNLATFMVFFLQERFSDLQGTKAAGPAANIMMFVGIFILLTALPSGWLSDRFGKKPLIAIAGALGVIGTVLIVLAPNLTFLRIAGCLIGAGTGFFYAANWALGTEIVPQDQAGRFLGLSNLAGAGAGAIGAYLGGPIGDNMGYGLLMGIYGLLFLFSIIALQGVKEPRIKRSLAK